MEQENLGKPLALSVCPQDFLTFYRFRRSQSGRSVGTC